MFTLARYSMIATFYSQLPTVGSGVLPSSKPILIDKKCSSQSLLLVKSVLTKVFFLSKVLSLKCSPQKMLSLNCYSLLAQNFLYGTLNKAIEVDSMHIAN